MIHFFDIFYLTKQNSSSVWSLAPAGIGGAIYTGLGVVVAIVLQLNWLSFMIAGNAINPDFLLKVATYALWKITRVLYLRISKLLLHFTYI